jgi:hypothetical protein
MVFKVLYFFGVFIYLFILLRENKGIKSGSFYYSCILANTRGRSLTCSSHGYLIALYNAIFRYILFQAKHEIIMNSGEDMSQADNNNNNIIMYRQTDIRHTYYQVKKKSRIFLSVFMFFFVNHFYTNSFATRSAPR